MLGPQHSPSSFSVTLLLLLATGYYIVKAESQKNIEELFMWKLRSHKDRVNYFYRLFEECRQPVHTLTDKQFQSLRGQSALLYSVLLQLSLLSILSLPDLPDVPHDGGITADHLGVLLTRHLQSA